MRSLILIALCASLCACAARAPSFPGPVATLGRPERPGLPMSESIDSFGGMALIARSSVPVPAQGPTAEAHSNGGDTQLVDAARFFLRHNPKGFRADCSGFICAIYDRAGAPLSGTTRSLWAMAKNLGVTHTRKVPEPGDLAFFDNTYDRDKDGRWDDELTHIAVVLEVEDDGTIVLAHNGTSRGRTTMRMNLKHPDDRVDSEGRVLNDYLRARSKRDPKKAVHLSGQLWRGFATVPTSMVTSP